MAKDINKELLEAIKATLPETQVGLIKEALLERDTLQKQVGELNKTVERAEKDRESFEEENVQLFSDLEKERKKTTELQNEIAVLKSTNDNLVKLDVERRANEALAELRGVQTTQELFLKNTIVREKVQHQVVDETPNMQPQYVNGQMNGYSQQGTNKMHKPVTDIKEIGTTDDKEETCEGGC